MSPPIGPFDSSPGEATASFPGETVSIWPAAATAAIDSGGVPEVFAIERPRIRRRRRRREPVLADASLPYFLCGTENRLLAYAATADASVLRIGHPIVLIGPSGTGKTAAAMHLAARAGVAIAMEADVDEPAETVYLPVADFVRDYADAIEVDDLPSLQSRLLDPPVLILDDIADAAGKAAGGELSRRLADRAAGGRVTLVTSRRSPVEIEQLDRTLASRLAGGLTIQLETPSVRTRSRLVREFALLLDLKSDDATLTAIEAALPDETTPRAIESLMRALRLRCQVDARPVDTAMIAKVTSDTPVRKVLTLEQIVRVTGRHYSIPTKQIRGSSRHRTTVLARAVAMWLGRKLVGTSTHRLGKHFGDRDHTTVMHALAKIDAAVQDDPTVRIAVESIEDRLLQS